MILKEEWELGLAKRVGPLPIRQKRSGVVCEKIGLGYLSLVHLIRPKMKKKMYRSSGLTRLTRQKINTKNKKKRDRPTYFEPTFRQAKTNCGLKISTQPIFFGQIDQSGQPKLSPLVGAQWTLNRRTRPSFLLGHFPFASPLLIVIVLPSPNALLLLTLDI